jgi:hypothetical protein
MNNSEVLLNEPVQENSETSTLSNSEEKKMSNNINVSIQPKKRGRKPKNLTQPNENIQENLEEHNSSGLKDKQADEENKEEEIKPEKILKKRGRKPKIKTPEELEIEKIPKKRGRKPKEKVYSVKELPKTFYEENKNETLILHLPIHLNEIHKKNNPEPIDEDNFSYIENNNNNFSQTNLPTQNNLLENNENHLMNYQELLSFDEIKKQPQYDDIQSVNDHLNQKINQFVSSSSSLGEIDNEKANQIENPNSLENVLEKNDGIKNVHDKNEQAWQHDSKNNNKVIKKNLRNILYEFINANNTNVWPEKTSTACWWCCHQFENIPCSLPQFYKRDKFYVKGIFCSFNCAASYNFNNSDNDMYEKYSLLNLMYKKLYNKNFVKINLAPPRETLKMFGGYLSIEEFRENALENNKLFNVISPPLISIIPKIEESVNHNKVFGHTLVNGVNENILNKTQNSLKLKRNKPVTNPNNTLQSFMDLKIL